MQYLFCAMVYRSEEQDVHTSFGTYKNSWMCLYTTIIEVNIVFSIICAPCLSCFYGFDMYKNVGEYKSCH